MRGGQIQAVVCGVPAMRGASEVLVRGGGHCGGFRFLGGTGAENVSV